MKPFGLAGQGWYGTHDIHTPLTFNTPGTGYSTNVKINGSFAHRGGDVSEPHILPIPPFPAHPETIIGEPGTVMINGKPAAPVGAKITGSFSVLYLPSYTVFFGDNVV